MTYLEKTIMVHEIKGLLSWLRDIARRTEFNLATDNIQQLPKELSHMRGTIDRITTKVEEYNKNQPKDEDELF